MPTRDNSILYFLHIPKTAGATLIYTLDNYFHQSEIFPALLLSELLQVPNLTEVINRCRFLRGHFDYNVCSLLQRPYQVITMLRDPIERSISQFEHIRRHPEGAYWDDTNLISNDTSFDIFLNNAEVEGFLENIQTRAFVPEWYDISRFKWDAEIPTPSEEMLLTLARKRLEACLFIGLQERFEDSLRLLFFRLNLRRPPFMTNYNVAHKRSKVSELSQDVRDRLYELNNLDLQLYAYGRSLFESRFAAMCSHLDVMFPGKSIDDQLDLYYDQHHAHQETWILAPARYTFDQPLVGTNWYQREAFHGNYVRWTGPGNTATIEYPLISEQDLCVEILSIGTILPEMVEKFSFQVNDIDIPLERSEGFPGVIFKGIIPARAFQTSIAQTLKFSVDKTVRASEIYPESASNRKLGICIYSIEFTEM